MYTIWIMPDAQGELARLLADFALWTHAQAWLAANLEPLPYVELQTMHAIAAHPGASVGEVARTLDKQQPNVSAAVASLVRRGLVERRRDTADARQVRLFQTPKAQADARTAARAAAKAVGPGLAHLTDADTAELTRLLAILVPALTTNRP